MLLLSSCSLYQPEGGTKVQDCGRVSGKPSNEAVCSARFENRAVGGRWDGGERRGAPAEPLPSPGKPHLPCCPQSRWDVGSAFRGGAGPVLAPPSLVLSLQWAGQAGLNRLSVPLPQPQSLVDELLSHKHSEDQIELKEKQLSTMRVDVCSTETLKCLKGKWGDASGPPP